jgi:hypothetical protein
VLLSLEEVDDDYETGSLYVVQGTGYAKEVPSCAVVDGVWADRADDASCEPIPGGYMSRRK